MSMADDESLTNRAVMGARKRDHEDPSRFVLEFNCGTLGWTTKQVCAFVERHSAEEREKIEQVNAWHNVMTTWVPWWSYCAFVLFRFVLFGVPFSLGRRAQFQT